MIKLSSFILAILWMKKINTADYTVNVGTYLEAYVPTTFACGPIHTHHLVFYSSYFTYIGESEEDLTSRNSLFADYYNGVYDTQYNAIASSITANEYTDLQYGNFFKFGSPFTTFTIEFSSNDFYEARVISRNQLAIADSSSDSFFFNFPVDVLKNSVTNLEAHATNNYYKQNTCLTITMQNPCVYLPPTTIFKITIPKTSYPDYSQFEINPFSNFDVMACDVTLNGQTNTSKSCSIDGDTLSISDLVPDFTQESNFSLKICNVQLNNTREQNSKIELVNSDYTSPSNLFADADFSIPVELGSILKKYLTSERTSIQDDYYFKFAFGTLEDIIINAGSTIEIDFSEIPHSISNIDYSIYTGTNVDQYGSLSCTNKKCTAVLDNSYNLKNDFVMDITGTKSEFGSMYNSSINVKFSNSSGNLLISEVYPLIRISSDYNAYSEDKDIGLASTLHLIFNNLETNTETYEFTISLGDFGLIDQNFFDELTINHKKIHSSDVTLDSNNNSLIANNIVFDSDPIQRIDLKGVYLGPYSAGWNQINFNLSQNSTSVHNQDIDLHLNMNKFTIMDVYKSRIPTGYRFNITFAYDYPIYIDHYLRIGLPKQYEINEMDWFRSTQIPYITAPSLSEININMSANLTYYKIHNLLSKTDSKATYSLIFDTELLDIEHTGEYVELDVFSDYSSISGLEDINSSYKISIATAKTINHKCPVDCYECSGDKDKCSLCSSSLNLNTTDNLCYQPNSMNQNVTKHDDPSNNNEYEYLFSEAKIETFNKVLTAIAFNFCVLTIILGLFIKLFYFEKSYLLEFLCASLTLVYSIVSYLFLLRISSELKKDNFQLEFIYMIVSVACYIFVNLLTTLYVYMKNKSASFLNNKIINNIPMKAIIFLICSCFGVSVCLLFNSLNLLSLFQKLYCDQKDVKKNKSVSLIVKWIASFTVLMFSASIILIYYISPIKSQFIYFYFVGSLLLFIAHLFTILHLNRAETSNDKLYDIKLRYDKNVSVVIKKENQDQENKDKKEENMIMNCDNSELNGYLKRIREFENNI